MHHALLIEEILLNIFSYCHTVVCHRPPRRAIEHQCCYANAHLATLARTCRTFKEPALDMIWAELNDLTPLVRCLPNEAWVLLDEPELDLHAVYSLKKPLEQTEWDIILGYAHRVRALPRLSGSLGLATDCIEALSKPPASTGSLFPNLRLVGLRKPNMEISPLLPHLTNPKVTDISFENIGMLGAALEAFGEECPSVADFQVLEWAYTETISNVIRHWQNLLSVHCCDVGLDINALLHLSRLRNLHYIAFRVHPGVVDRIQAARPSPSALTFSALRDLRLGSLFLDSIWMLVRHFRFPVVHGFSVGIHTRPTSLDLMSFFVALQEACTHTSLNDLLVRVYDSNDEYMIPFAEISPRYFITFDRLCPLTAFVNIKSITLDMPYGVDLNERELLSLASSWPHLETFEVGKNRDWTPSSALTPGGFLQLLERCRSLRVLYFMFDTRGYTDIPRGHPWRGLKMPDHAIIHLLNSPIEEASIEALGVFFHVAPYPNFSLTTHWNNRYFQGSERPRELCDLYYDRWVRARELARDLWGKGRNLRRSLETRSTGTDEDPGTYEEQGDEEDSEIHPGAAQ